MTSPINDVASDFDEYIGDSWSVLISHPKDFTPVCTNELGYMAALQAEFEKRADHSTWRADIENSQGNKVTYPMIGDANLKVAKLYGMLPAETGDTPAGHAATNTTVCTVFMIGPARTIKAMLVYPMTTGRNFDEVQPVLDSLQLTAKHQVATPVNWKPANDMRVVAALSNEDAAKKYPAGRSRVDGRAKRRVN